MLPSIFVIFARSQHTRAIGKGGKLPWKLPEDLHFFKSVTIHPGITSVLIMGRKTWESLPTKPLALRTNVVISSTNQEGADYTFKSVQEAIWYFKDTPACEIYIIGGAAVYKEVFQLGLVDGIFETVVLKEYPDCDTFMPELPEYESKSLIQKTLKAEYYFYSI